MQHNDKVFAQKLKSISPFCFDEKVAQAFDDMVNRSIPYYQEIHQLILDIIDYKFQDGDVIYDLGCSTGTTIKLMSEYLANKKTHFIGIDNSAPMIKEAKLKTKDINHKVDVICDDIGNIEFKKCGIVIMNYTLQFIAPDKRYELVKKVYEALRPGGIFIFSEKIQSPESNIQKLITNLYYDFKKRNGYSELEISQKREALDNILISYTEGEQLSLLQKSGFNQSEMIFRWYNFACFLGMKENERTLH